MLSGLKNKLSVFLILFGAYNIIEPILTGTTYDPNNIILLAVSIIAFGFLLISKRVHGISILGIFGILIFAFLFLFIDGGFSFSYYTKLVIFAISLLFYYVMLQSNENISESNYKVLYLSVLLQLIFFVIESFDSSAYMTMRSGTYLILCFDNKNSTAMHLLTLCCILILYAERIKHKEGKRKTIVPLLAFVVCLYFIVLTGSRSSLIGALFIIPFYFLPKLKRRVSKLIMFCFLLSPIIFAAIYIALYNAGYGDLQLFGRTLFNGRQDLWIPVFEGDLFDWLFGMYSNFARPDGVPFQLHNGIVDLIASYGLIVTTAFLFMIYKLLSALLESCSDTNRMVVICICALVLQTIGEAALFNGTRAVYICMIMMFIERKSNNGIERTNQGITSNRIKYSS